MAKIKFHLLIIAFNFIFFNYSLASDKYTVIKVMGSIVVKKTGVQLSQGDVILDDEPIVFKSPDAKASVISAIKGRFVLSAGNKQNNNSALKSNLLPPISNISSRSGLILNLNDFKTNFNGNYLILNKAEFPVSKVNFPMNDSCFFYFSYNYNNEAINKKLKHKQDTLLIIEKELYMLDGKEVAKAESTGVKLNYISGKKVFFINEFTIITPPNENLVNEVKLILDQSKNKKKNEIVKDVVSYFNEFYGKCDEDNVLIWLKDNFGI
ncbi:MAG: hypothetical protein ACK50A_07155 [Sphingobacteriaceae bacterium]|jgi:hypothetical protein